MNRVHRIAFHLLVASLAFWSCLATGTQAQTSSPSPAPSATPAAPANPFAPQSAPPLPAGMTGSDINDPRAKLSPGMYDAGEAAMGIKHLMLLKKPDAFELGSNDPNDPKVNQTLTRVLGVGDPSKMPGATKLVLAGLGFANSDIAFQGNHLFLGNFYGVNIYDISNPSKTSLLTSMICPGGQGDVSVYQNLMFMSVEMANGRLDCGTAGFPPNPPPPAGQENKPSLPAAQKDRFRGVRIFDITDVKNPKQVAAVQTCRGSHTHTLVVDPNDKNNVYIYVSGTSFVRQNEELAGCSGEAPDKDPNTALFRIDVIKVPLAAPQNAQVVSSPRVFVDPGTGALNGLNNGGTHGKNGLDKPSDTNQCHDITVYSALGLAAGACSGNGILLDIKDPVHPKRVDAVNDPNYSYWHSASFSNDGTKVVFTDEWGGGLGARCRANDPNKWGIARGLDIFDLTPTKDLTQNEIDAAKTVRVAQFNVQNQEKIEWPRQLVVAQAYVDQLERSQGLPADQITVLRKALQSSEASHMNRSELAKLKSLAPSLEKSAAMTKSTADSNRLRALAEILKRPVQ